MNKLLRLMHRYTAGAVFVIILAGALWVHDSVKAVRTPQLEAPAELYANQLGDNLTHVFTSAIDQAQHSVLLIIYSLTDPSVIKALKDKSQEGVEVRVIIDAKTSPTLFDKLSTSRISLLQRFGRGLMHQKILVIDGSKVWIGSANMTSESLQMHGNLVMGIDNPLLAQMIAKKAAAMKVEGRSTPFSDETFSLGNQQMEMWFLPDNADAIGRIKSLIRTAEKTLRVAMFTWTRQDFAKAVIHAVDRGVDVQVVIDQQSGAGASAIVVRLLQNAGVDVKLSKSGPLLHHKFMYIDGTTLVNGSANWTKAAFSDNDDCFVVLHPLTDEQQETMERLWKVIYQQALPIGKF